MGAGEDAVITVRLDLKNRYSAIMEETQMDSSELMEHFFSLYNSNVEKVWTESDESKQAKQQGLQKETEYWMRKVMSRPDHDKLFPKSHDPDSGADNNSTDPPTSKDTDIAATEDRLSPSDRDIETIPALQVGRKQKCPRKIILTLPENILSKDISINVSKRSSKVAKTFCESKTKTADFSSSTVTTDVAKQTDEEEAGEEPLVTEESPPTPNIKVEPEASGDDAEIIDSGTPAAKESSPELEGEKSNEVQNQIDDEGVANEDSSMNCSYIGRGEDDDEEEDEEGESLEMSVEEIGDNYQMGMNKGDNVKFVRDVALSIAKDMAVTENGETIFNCNFCSYKTNVLGRLRRHITVHTGKEFKCPYCSKAYTEKCKLTEHIKVKHEKSVSYPCPKCSKVFTSKRGLEYHNITFHEERGTTLKCSFCPKVFSSRFGFTYHTKTAHGENKIEENFKSTSDTLIPMSKWEKSTMKKETEKEFQKDSSGMYNCKLCEYKTPRMFHIRRHLGVHYGNTNKCEQCDKTFSDSYKLRLHVQVKHGNLRFDCDYCHRDFGTKEGLKYHRLSAHEGNWKYLCPDCGQGFYQKHHFEGHVNKHKGIKAYGCKTCGKKFFYQSDVSIHKKHCGQERKPLEKPTTFVCHVCGDQFKKKSILIEHENGKHGRVGHYVCECGVSFKWRNSLRQHKQRCSTAAAISDYSVTDITDLSGASDFIAMQIKPELDSETVNAETADMEAMETDDNQPDDITYSQTLPPDVDTENNTAAELENENDDQDYVVKEEPRESEMFQHGAMLTPPGVATNALYEMPAAQVSDQEGNESDYVIYPDGSSTSSSDDCPYGSSLDCSEEEGETGSSRSSKPNDIAFKRELSCKEWGNKASGTKLRCPRCGKIFRMKHALRRHQNICHRQAVIRRSVIEMYVCGFCDGRFSNKAHFKEHSKTHERKMRKKFKIQQYFKRKTKEQLNNDKQNKSVLDNVENTDTLTQADVVFEIPVNPTLENDMESEGESKLTSVVQGEDISSGNTNHTLISDHISAKEAAVCVGFSSNSGHCDEQPQYIQADQEEEGQDINHTHSKSFETTEESRNVLKPLDQGKDFPFVNVAVVDLSNAQEYNHNKDVGRGWDLSLKPNQAGFVQDKDRGNSESTSALVVDEDQRTKMSGDFQNSFTCEICGATIDDHEKYISHISLHAVTRIQMFQEQQNSLTNKDSNTNVQDSGNLQMPNWNTTEVGKVDFTCKICGDVFMKRSYLKEHILGMHGNINRYSCVCGERFKWRSSLNLHKEKCPSSPSRNISNGKKHVLLNQPNNASAPFQGPSKLPATSKIGSKRKSPIARSSLPLPPISSSLSPRARMLPVIPPHFMDVRTSTVLGMMPSHRSPTTSYAPVMETRVQAGEMYLHSVAASNTESQLSDQQSSTHLPSTSFERSSTQSNNKIQQKNENGHPSHSVVPTGMFRSNGPDFPYPVSVSKDQVIRHQWSSGSTQDTDQQQQETEVPVESETRIKQEVISFDEEPETRIEMNDSVMNQLMLATADPPGNSEVPQTEPHLVSNTRPEHQIKLKQEFSSYNCGLCKKQFRSPNAYNDHMNKHRGIKPYPCTNCGMSFHYQSILSSHKKTCGMTGNNMYKCHICGDTFTVRGYLREHVLGKHGDARRYSCQCGAAFKWRSSLGSHQKKCPLISKN
ncbi:uncharacterized protein LOC132545075 [Ylistrum balloti]|uniref:uncharacterized protein LOC132545075 n=1 Tax=Ylistrum balloti TaxID=509963 RepID=UPI00290582F7|nr:uncharacterized protein LOC132545075 [Ylistrum balloti]